MLLCECCAFHKRRLRLQPAWKPCPEREVNRQGEGDHPPAPTAPAPQAIWQRSEDWGHPLTRGAVRAPSWPLESAYDIVGKANLVRFES